MEHDLATLLRRNVSELLLLIPFNELKYICGVDSNNSTLQLINYDSEKNGLSIVCDSENRIQTIFLFNKKNIDANTNVKFNWRRDIVRNYFGDVSEVKRSFIHPILGRFGESDIFIDSRSKIHVEYNNNLSGVKMYTFMSSDS